MSWQSRIYNKYRLDEPIIKIISDFTGLLLSHDFLEFLIQENRKYIIAKSIPEIINSQSEDDRLIITAQLNIPSFLKKQVDTYTFRFEDIPFNGSTNLLSNFETKEIISILEYLDAENPHFSLTQKNYKELADAASQYQSIKECHKYIRQIKDRMNEELSLDSVRFISDNWSKLQYQSYLSGDTSFTELTTSIDHYCSPFFESGMWKDVFYSAPSSPLSIDKIIPNIKTDKSVKKALLCFDCMGIPEWYLLKNYLDSLDLTYEESYIFSLIPSITSIARSAIYAGTYSVYDKSSPGQRSEEKDLKSHFGDDKTKYLREKDYKSKDDFIGYNTVSILLNFFDDLSHSAIIQESSLNKFAYYNSVRDYLSKSKVLDIFQDLVSEGFSIYICSDHGSTIAKGNGQKLDKFIQDKFAKRGTLIDKESAPLIKQKTIIIPFIDDKLVVIPENREMFSNKDEYEINHGGISIDEMIVPYVKVIKE